MDSINKKLSINKLFSEFSKSIDYKSGNTKKLFTIRFIGLNGTGKTYIAKILSEKLNLYIASNDEIRRFLNKKGLRGKYPDQQVVRKMAGKLSPYLYNHRISHIYDTDHIAFYRWARGIATKHGSEFYLVHVVCPEKIVFKRIEERLRRVRHKPHLNLSRADVKEYMKRKALHEKLGLPKNFFFTIDTSKNKKTQTNQLVRKLEKEGVI